MGLELTEMPYTLPEINRLYSAEEIRELIGWRPFRLFGIESPEAYEKRGSSRINDITDKLALEHPKVEIMFNLLNDGQSDVTTERFVPDGNGKYSYVGRKVWA